MYKVKLDLIENEKRTKYWFTLSLLVVNFILLLIFLFVFENEFWKNFFLFLILFQLAVSIFKKEKRIGKIELNESQIIVNFFKNEKFLVENLSDIKLKYNGAEGTFYSAFKTIVLNDGTNNHLQFNLENKEYKYRFKVKLNDVKSLKYIIGIWKNNFKNTEIIGRF
jgi:hypothetical protein